MTYERQQEAPGAPRAPAELRHARARGADLGGFGGFFADLGAELKDLGADLCGFGGGFGGLLMDLGADFADFLADLVVDLVDLAVDLLDFWRILGRIWAPRASARACPEDGGCQSGSEAAATDDTARGPSGLHRAELLQRLEISRDSRSLAKCAAFQTFSNICKISRNSPLPSPPNGRRDRPGAGQFSF